MPRSHLGRAAKTARRVGPPSRRPSSSLAVVPPAMLPGRRTSAEPSAPCGSSHRSWSTPRSSGSCSTLQFQLTGRATKLFGIVYVIGSVALLLPTHRQGRIIRRPAESLVKVAEPARPDAADHRGAHAHLRAPAARGVQHPGLRPAVVGHHGARHARSPGDVQAHPAWLAAAATTSRTRSSSAPARSGSRWPRALEDNPEFGLLPVGFVDRFDERLPLPARRSSRAPATRSSSETQVRHVVLAFGAATEAELVSDIRACSVPAGAVLHGAPVLRAGRRRRQRRPRGRRVRRWCRMRRPGHGHSMWPLKRAFDICRRRHPAAARLAGAGVCALAGEAVEPRSGVLQAGPGRRRAASRSRSTSSAACG